jgi:hypothetical protein
MRDDPRWEQPYNANTPCGLPECNRVYWSDPPQYYRPGDTGTGSTWRDKHIERKTAYYDALTPIVRVEFTRGNYGKNQDGRVSYADIHLDQLTKDNDGAN